MSDLDEAPKQADSWFSDEAFWETSYPYMFPAERFEKADAELEAVLDLVGQTPKRVLDLACGPGRHAVAAAKRGMDVVGVDRSAFLLGKARDLAAREGVEVEWVHTDMRDAVLEEKADVVLNLFTSFGYFPDDRENQRVLEGAYQSLNAGGSLVLDVAGKEILARIFLPDSVDDTPDGMVVQRRRITDGWTRIENEWTFVSDGAARSFQLGHWLYSGRELREMLFAAGFQDVSLYGDFEGAGYGPEADRLVAVARKA